MPFFSLKKDKPKTSLKHNKSTVGTNINIKPKITVTRSNSHNVTTGSISPPLKNLNNYPQTALHVPSNKRLLGKCHSQPLEPSINLTNRRYSINVSNSEELSSCINTALKNSYNNSQNQKNQHQEYTNSQFLAPRQRSKVIRSQSL